MVERGKLHAYHATTYDDDLAGQLCGGQGIRRIPYMRVVLDARYGRYEIGTTRADHEVLGLVGLTVTLNADGRRLIPVPWPLRRRAYNAHYSGAA